MTGKFTIGIVGLTILLFAPSRIGAQENTQQNTPEQKTESSKTTRSEKRRLTGCVLRGDIADNYKFRAKDGTVWDIEKSNKSIKINPYVGHTVTVIGSVTPNPYSAKDEAKAGTIQRDLSKNNAGIVEISKVTKTGAACTE